ncbi:ATP-binding cassette sub-family C member 4-like [Babylonia areolata]|uniref:ATP-binding cassette sub-family C member 4-like n=1 Tax=Babylonia areolata TaxID=304850 RepID=UPI003FD2DB7B
MSKERRKTCLYDQANFLSKLTFWWLNPFFTKSPQAVAETSDQYDVSASEEADLLERRLDGSWKKEVQQFSEGGNADLRKALLLSTFLLQWTLPGLILFLAEATRVCQPVVLGVILGHVGGEAGLAATDLYLHGLALACVILLHAVLCLAYMFLSHRAALRMKTALEALLYRKVMALSSEAALLTSASTVLDLFSSCPDVLTGAVENVHYLWVGPIEVAVVTYLLYREVGTAGLVCLAMVVAVVLLHTVLEVAVVKIRERTQTWREQRWQITSRVLSVMTQIKICCLETSLTAHITSLRSKELCGVRGQAATQGFLWWLLGAACRLMLLVVVMVAVDSRGAVSVRAVFTSLALLDVLVWCLHRFPVSALRDWLVMQSTLSNIQAFLLLDEEKEQIKDLRLHRTVSYRNEPYADWVVDIDHMTARWPTVHTGGRKRFQKRRVRDSTSSTKSLLHESDVEHAFSLKYLSLQVKKGELLAVIGPQLSGKTSLLMTLIGELPYEIGQISVNGRVSFCAQEPWLFSGSVRDNILFGDSYDSARYEMVIRACSLNKLLEILPKGDETVVGERGLELSSGYKAKLTLARAVYHNADIYLLDEIFNFVDTQTRQDIVRWCVSGMLESKTRVIVTRNLQFLKAASRIAVLREGSLYDMGSYEELISRGVNIREFISTEQSHHHKRDQLEAEEENFRIRLALLKAQKDDVKSDDLSRQSDFHLLFTFLRGKVFWSLLPLFVVMWLGAQALVLAADWTLATWVSSQTVPSSPARNQTTPLPANIPSSIGKEAGLASLAAERLELYTVLVAVGAVTGCVFALAFVELLVSAAKRCHDKMLTALMRAKAGCFLVKSADAIMTTFSSHLSVIDAAIPCLSYLTADVLLRVFGLMVIMCAINPWLVIAVVPVIAVMVTLQVFGARTLKGVRMFKETAQEPVMADVLETLQGLHTIRAFRRQDHFLEGFDSHLNQLSWSRFLGLCVHSRLVLICVFAVIFFLSVVIYVSITLVGNIHVGLLALCITYCVTFFMPVQSLVRYIVCLGNSVVSVREALLLKGVDQEPPWVCDKPPPDDWPNRGSITFSNTSLLAGPAGPYLLRDINVHIKSKEKVGVVGEVGSGKYSLVAALLRLGQVQGMIFMDGFDVLKIGLHELRKNIAVVSKDAELFHGTLRSNLDRTGTVSDEELWGVLDQVGLRDRVAGIRGGLSADVGVDSSLLSLGQRQLLCLAEALLRKTKVVLFDEPTEQIEHGLSDQIQRILRAKFRDCTVLTIAHRLHSVMDCDRIMVFHQGEVKEFDTPYNLMQTEDGYFTRLVEQCGKRQAQHLRGLAELSHQQRASASLMLEHAVFMATEQLHASTEDLTFRPGSLAWSNTAKFSKSQDSLEKAYSDWGSRGDVRAGEEAVSPVSKAKPPPAIAPSQKLINKRRMNPNRGRNHSQGGLEVADKEDRGDGGEEQMPLLSYDTPPKSVTSNSAEREEKGSGRERGRMYRPSHENSPNSRSSSSPHTDHRSFPRPRVQSPTGTAARGLGSNDTQPSRAVERKVIETLIDTPPAPRRNFSPFPSSSDNTGAAPDRVKGRKETSRGKAPPRVGYQPGRARIISGEYTPAADNQDDTEKIIYC